MATYYCIRLDLFIGDIALQTGLQLVNVVSLIIAAGVWVDVTPLGEGERNSCLQKRFQTENINTCLIGDVVQSFYKNFTIVVLKTVVILRQCI